MLSSQSAVYDPEELSLLGQILDVAVQSLPESMRTPYNCAQIARNILACAATGERDRVELELAAFEGNGRGMTDVWRRNDARVNEPHGGTRRHDVRSSDFRDNVRGHVN
jgi:hypothetical protein